MFSDSKGLPHLPVPIVPTPFLFQVILSGFSLVKQVKVISTPTTGTAGASFSFEKVTLAGSAARKLAEQQYLTTLDRDRFNGPIAPHNFFTHESGLMSVETTSTHFCIVDSGFG